MPKGNRKTKFKFVVASTAECGRCGESIDFVTGIEDNESWFFPGWRHPASDDKDHKAIPHAGTIQNTAA
jgi:hypothetical protein